MEKLMLVCTKCEKVMTVDYYSDVYRCPICCAFMREYGR